MSDKKSKGRPFNGLKAAADLLNSLGKTDRERILKGVHEQDPLMAKKIEKNLFLFEDFMKLKPEDLQTFLREAPKAKLILALRNASDEFKQTIYKNISQRAADDLASAIENQGPQKLSSILHVQQELIELARRLEALGKISLFQGD
jgi:flagellar motor switch protein FliG